MDLVEFIRGIELKNQGAEIVLDENFCSQYDSYCKLFYENQKEFILKVENENDPYRLFLWLYCRFALKAFEQYEKRNIGKDIFFDTFRDFTVWARVCERETGVYGLKEADWLAEALKLKIFKLGRLQFQPAELEHDVVLNEEKFIKGTAVLNVHIRAGEKLSVEECEKSYARAIGFFGIRLFICDSWLLSPSLDCLLPENSNMRKFKGRYTIISVDKDSRAAERYIFGNAALDNSEHAEPTSFIVKVKEYMLSGKFIGSAFGIFKL